MAGQWGRAVGEAWRQALPEPYSFTAPVRARGSPAGTGQLHCLLPHEVFASLHSKVPMVFEELFGSYLQREDWWAELERTAQEAGEGLRAAEHRRWCRQHPCAGAEPLLRVPFGMHGDAG